MSEDITILYYRKHVFTSTEQRAIRGDQRQSLVKDNGLNAYNAIRIKYVDRKKAHEYFDTFDVKVNSIESYQIEVLDIYRQTE